MRWMLFVALTALGFTGCEQRGVHGGSSAPGVALAAPAVEPGQRPAAGYVGFDRNVYPGDDRLAELHRSFAFTGYWLNVPPGATANSWAGKRTLLRDAGFGFLVLFNGHLEKEIKASKSTPANLGKREGAGAVAAAAREGFPKGAVIFLDQEEGGRLTDPQAGYFFAWTEAVAASAYKPGAYLSGQKDRDGAGPDGKPLLITTAQDVREHIAKQHLHDVALWVYDDTCPPAPGCTLAAPRLADGGTPDAIAWQYAQSPRRPELTKSCASTYAADGLCYADATKDIFLDLNVAREADPSHGR